MFTGLIVTTGEVQAIEAHESRWRVRIGSSLPMERLKQGASIACSGPCLTIIHQGQMEQEEQNWFEVDVGLETLERTNIKSWKKGTYVNLEPSLRLNDEWGGHMVTGHIDGQAQIIARTSFEGLVRFDFEAPPSLKKFIAEKGSVSLEGTSLTVNRVEDHFFSVLLIPHSLSVTTWNSFNVGDRLNLEVDLMARYAVRWLEIQKNESFFKMYS